MTLWEHPEIVRLGQPGDEALRQVAVPLEPGSRQAREVCHRLMQLLTGDRGAAGLAAPQIGESVQAVVVRLSTGVQALVNPEIVEISDDVVFGNERCFSVPGVERTIGRPSRVFVRAVNAKGKPVGVRADGWDARIVLHELDHLVGRLIDDELEERAA